MPFLLPLIAGSVAGTGLYTLLNRSVERRTAHTLLALHDIALDLEAAGAGRVAGRQENEELSPSPRLSPRHASTALSLSAAIKESWNRHLLWASLSASRFVRETDWHAVGETAYERGRAWVERASDRLQRES